MSLSALAKQRILRLETYAKFPYLIEITRVNQNDEEEVYRYANSDTPITFEGNVYQSGYFSIEPPEEKAEGITDARLTMSAIDTEHNWIGKIRETQKRAKIRFVAVIEYDQNNQQNIEVLEDNDFVLTVASWNRNTIQWTMKFDELCDIQIPLVEVTSQVCPALG